MVSAWTSGRPALIIVANCRVKTTTSRVFTPPPNLKLILSCLGAGRTCTTTMRFLRRWAMTSSRDGRSTSPCWRSPFRVRAVYWKTGMIHSRRRLAARGNLGLTGLRRAGLRQRFPLIHRLLADHAQEFVGVRAHAEALVLTHLAVHVQLVERIEERLHPVLLPGLHRRLDLVDLVVADQGPDGGGADHDLRRHHPAAPLRLLEQSLGDHPLQHKGELRPDLGLLVRREDVDDAVDRLGRRVGVERGERQVAGLGDGERRLRGLEIAHFADQHDVRVLPQRVLERRREAVGVGSDLALVDDAALMAVDELDRILHRDDVSLQLLVDLVDHRGERSALPGAGGPRDEHQAARPLGQLRHDLGETQVVERADVERNLPDDERHAATLLEAVAAEPRQVLDPEREVELVLGLEALLLALGQHRVGERQRVLGRQHFVGGGVRDVAVDAQLGPLPRHDVQVGGVFLDHLLEQRPQVHRHAAVSFTTSSSVVTPRLTFTIPSIRSVSMPSFTACSRSSSVEPPFSTMRRTALVIAITSYSPCRPLYPVSAQVSHPWPLMNVRCFASASGMPKACSSSSEYLCSALQLEQTRRTRRCATMRFTALATLNGSIPMSIMRVTVDGASLVCSVDSTR